MKHILFLLAFAYAHIAISQTIVNQNFELSDTSSGSGFLAWKSRSSRQVGRDESTRHSGGASLRLNNVPGQNFSTFSQMLSLSPASALRKFRITGFIKRDSVERYTGIWINVFAGGNSLFFDNMYNRNLNGSADWAELHTEFFADETATEIQVGGLLVGKGTAWFDDFSIAEIPTGAGSLPDSLRSYISEAIDIVQQNALHRDSVADWPKIRERAFLMVSDAVSYEGCYPAIQYVLGKLGDHHSFLMSATNSKAWAEPEPDAYKKMPLTTGEMLDGGIAYLKMPSVSSGSEAANTYFADQLHDLLEKLDRSRPKGWILDLRGNGGGNCWPMLAGIGPLLGDGVCGYFIEPGREAPEGWFYRKGKSGVGKNAITRVSRKPFKLNPKLPPVAVLTGPRTGSSGEVVTVAFRKRPNTRSFGEPTAGLSTGNQNFALRDGAQILLTTCIYADRSKEIYGSKIAPDEMTPAPDGATDAGLWRRPKSGWPGSGNDKTPALALLRFYFA